MEREIKIYWLFLMFAFVYQIGLSLAAYNHLHNIFFIVLFQVIEYSVLSILFYMWNPNKFLRFFILFFLVFNLISWMYFYIGENINYSISIDKHLRNFILIPLSFFTTYKFAISSERDLLNDAKFWILSGVLINIALCSFVLVLRSYSLTNSEVHNLSEGLLVFVNLVTYILFIKGFLCLQAKSKYSGSSLS